ncbi:MAG: pilus assembly protein TadG-related protein, partial [Chloroflexota bacterium]|nr:pilus assembly protein TadG-related protein [Chloroflexota bacterium]
MVISFTALLAFVGMVTDIGSVYITYTQLKRAVDTAAVAAANNIKNPSLTYSERKTQITEAAREMLAFHNVTDITSLEAYICDDAPSIPAEFDAACPDAGESARKMAWVQATQDVPVYFLSLFGVESIPLTTHAIGEAATVDLVIVIDSSESMASEDDGEPYTYVPGNFNPATCEPN